MKNKILSSLLTIGILSLSSCTKVPEKVVFTLKDFPTNVSIHTDFQKDFLSSTNKTAFNVTNASKLCRFSNSGPNKVKLSWNIEIKNGSDCSDYALEISKANDFLDAISYPSSVCEVELYNLEVNQNYFGRIKASWGDTSFYSDVFTFTSETIGPRNICIDGVENVRDLGGYVTESGKVVKQGLLYRCAQLNYDNNDPDALPSKITEKGIYTFENQLKIKTEIDLRKNGSEGFKDDETYGIKSSPVSSNVNYIQCPMVYGGKNVFEQDINKQSIKNFFEAVSNKDNLPLCFHCVRGTDRTGALAYVIGTLLGIKDNDLINDYLFSNFANIDQTTPLGTNSIDTIKYKILEESGNDMSEKTRQYLYRACGVSLETSQKIIDNLLIEKA